MSPENEKTLYIFDIQGFILALGRPKQSIIEPHLPGYENINRVPEGELIGFQEGFVACELDIVILVW
jgi:hypothetical protein